METTRSRRSSNALRRTGMKSCGPFTPSTEAHCTIVQAAELRGLQPEGVIHGRRHEHRLAAVDEHHIGIADPIRRGDDDLVALVERGQEGVVENLLAASADDRLRRLVVEAVLALELGGDRL